MNVTRLVLYTLFIPVVLLVGLFVYFYRKQNEADRRPMSQSCTTTADCAKGQKCISDPNRSSQSLCAEAHMMNCEFDHDFSKLISCTLDDPSSCTMCVNQPAFKCQVVHFGKPQLLTPGRNYTSGTYQAALIDPVTSTYNTLRDMNVSITVADTVNGTVDRVRILDPKQQYKQGDMFLILGGNNEAKIRLTEPPAPFFWQKGNTKLVLPETEPGKGWCLPPVIQSAQCNPFTSDAVLMQKIDDTTGKMIYEWGCYCKVPSLMQHDSTPGSNCSALVGCGGYDLYVPETNATNCSKNSDCTAANQKCCSDTKCLQSLTDTFSGGSLGRCMTRWATGDTTRNPRDGTCDCPSNTYYNTFKSNEYVLKSCSVDPCGPNGVREGSNLLCTCKPGFVSCGLQSGTGVQVTDARCATPTMRNRCLVDPCAPGGTMRQGGGCNCRLNEDYVETNDPNAIGGKICKKLCVNNGPCGTRGKCKIVAGKEECECICPYTAQDATDKFCNLRVMNKSREGEECQSTFSTKMEYRLGQFVPVSTQNPVTDSCCSGSVCQMPGPTCVRQ